jgi:hypothetical protein
VEALDRVCGRLISEDWYITTITQGYHHKRAELPGKRVYRPNSFLEYAASSGLNLYVDAKLRQLPRIYYLREPSILACATFSAVASVETCLPTIALLLREGYHPNAEVNRIVIVWQMILDDLTVLFWNESREVRSSVYFAHKASWLSLCKLFVVNGADLSMRLALDRGAALSLSLTIPEYLNRTFSNLPEGSVK